MCDIRTLTLKIQESSSAEKDFSAHRSSLDLSQKAEKRCPRSVFFFFPDCLWVSFRELFFFGHSHREAPIMVTNLPLSIILWNSGKIIFMINFLKRPPYLGKCEFDWEFLVVLKPNPESIIL